MMTTDKKSDAAVEAYLAAQPEDARVSLLDLRAKIRASVPHATEVISYGVPTFRLRKGLVAYGATKSHCTFYIMSMVVTEAHKEDLKGYKTGKGSVAFPFGERLPAELVEKLVKARIAENEGKRALARPLQAEKSGGILSS